MSAASSRKQPHRLRRRLLEAALFGTCFALSLLAGPSKAWSPDAGVGGGEGCASSLQEGRHFVWFFSCFKEVIFWSKAFSFT